MSLQLSWSIIKQFSLRNKYGFTFQDVVKEFPEKNLTHLARILSEMTDSGMLYKVARDIYHIIPMNADPGSYVPEGHQIAKYLMQNKEYYIGYASALRIHGISCLYSNPPSSTWVEETKIRNAGAGARAGAEDEAGAGGKHTQEFVVTLKQMKPAIISYGGTTCHFIKHYVTRFFGFESVWINEQEKANVSDLEKTIVDLVTSPQQCGGITEVGKVLFQAKDRIDTNRLFYYLSRNMNKSAKKRFLYLSDLLALEWTDKHDKLMAELGSGISRLDPSTSDRGKKRSKFGLEINVDPITIKNEVLHRNFGPAEDVKA